MTTRYRNFGVRTATTLIGGSGLVLFLWKLGHLGVFAFSAFLALGLAYEASALLFDLRDRTIKQCLVFVLSAVALAVGFLYGTSAAIVWFAAIPVIGAAFFLLAWRTEGVVETRRQGIELLAAFFIWTFLVLPPVLLPVVADSIEGGSHALLALLLVVWTNDIGAYLVGSRFGQTRLAPSISPKKSVEGAIGGTVLSVAMAAVAFPAVMPSVGKAEAVLVGLALSLFAQVGDLIESLIKRAASEKDSGNLIPGHGGVWDRFDSVVFCLPVWYLWLFQRAGNGL